MQIGPMDMRQKSITQIVSWKINGQNIIKTLISTATKMKRKHRQFIT